MHAVKPSLMLATALVIGLAVWASARVDRSAGAMATAAERFLASLDQGQKSKAAFAFDDPERLNWHFIPRARKGLPIKEMAPEQRALAFGLLESGLGTSGSLKATTIMSLEAILRDIEQGRGPVRDPELYYVSVFGTPSNQGRWGWRIEGHHLSLNFTLEDGEIISATPAFFGANPAEVRDGPRKGLRTLAEVEDRALRLLQALDETQREAAVLSTEVPKDVKSGELKGESGGLSAKPPGDAPEGVSYAQLNANQQQMLRSLVMAYAESMPGEVAEAWLDEIRTAGPENVRFGWYGPADRSQPHAYKVQGPTFLIEFNNTQNNANHIHSLWRATMGDFGLAAR
jgi:hypothetical protein